MFAFSLVSRSLCVSLLDDNSVSTVVAGVFLAVDSIWSSFNVTLLSAHLDDRQKSSKIHSSMSKANNY